MAIATVYKKRGETPLECLKHFKDLHGLGKDVSVTYAGRLDPLAEGLLILLTGEDVHKKDEFISLPKTYSFEILWGFETDTYDPLGLIVSQSKDIPQEKDIQAALPLFLGKRTQVYPVYSSKPVQGKPLFAWAREGALHEIDIPTKEIEIFNFTYEGSKQISQKDIKEYIVGGVDTVSGDFRQEEICKGWTQALQDKEMYSISLFTVECSSGTYVRSLAHMLAQKLGSCGIALSIKRLSVGPYKLP